ncbi:2-aminomuconic semialdehyde dehydrogenase [Methylocaldum marinum]|uniref:2-aminomuconic semialdehyde dehydrogenase n=1 Tax=Methylocaldum marinum TaxID=1432792 RepID=A0A250KUU8_9GAMM|nr:aldehyde dehydrogenase [Methylocaldum marinum]BBA35443.1 2-aminomuconic semialdehyde dehydrogenase [Methylocaldum marinum]
MQRIANYIAGELVPPVSGRYLENIEPATGRCYSEVADSDAADIDRAVAAAKKAFPAWAEAPLEERSRLLRRIADLIEAKADALARAESVDVGKPLSAARQIDIPRAAANFQFFSSAIQHFFSESHAMGSQALNYTLRVPLGVVGCISPWNLPLYLFTWKVAPALAAGNTVVAKPSELTPMTAFYLSEICREAGLPPGVLNIVHGTGAKAGQSLVEHPNVEAISFTGGTQTGARIAGIAAPKFKKLSLELGGKNPNIIFADCDFERAVSTTVRSSFLNQGEICLSGSRIFVERPIYETFRDEFLQRTRALRVADPLSGDSDVGALISESHLRKVLSYIDLAQTEGGRILTGGKRVRLEGRCENGFFVEPTIIEGLSPDCRVNQEEIFGPVVTLMPFDHEDEAVEYANSTMYGLSATVWSESLKRCHRLANRIHSGVIWINCWLLRDLRTPFGGMKQSGVGREGGFEALKFFTEAKNVCVYCA